MNYHFHQKTCYPINDSVTLLKPPQDSYRNDSLSHRFHHESKRVLIFVNKVDGIHNLL